MWTKTDKGILVNIGDARYIYIYEDSKYKDQGVRIKVDFAGESCDSYRDSCTLDRYKTREEAQEALNKLYLKLQEAQNGWTWSQEAATRSKPHLKTPEKI